MRQSSRARCQPRFSPRAGTVLQIWKSQRDHMENALPYSVNGHIIPEHLLGTRFYSKC